MAARPEARNAGTGTAHASVPRAFPAAVKLDTSDTHGREMSANVTIYVGMHLEICKK